MDKNAAKKTFATAAKAQKRVHLRDENAIPDYEFLFDENSSRSKKKVNLIGYVLKQNVWKILFGTILYIIKASPTWAMPLITAEIINVATNPGDDALQKIAVYAVLLTLFLVQNVPMHAWYAKVNDKMLRDTSAGMKSMVVRKLQSLSITYHKQMETGKIQSKFLKDTNTIDALFTTIIDVIVPNLIGVIIAVIISAARSGSITVFFLLIIPCNVLLAKLFGKIIRKNNSAFRKQSETMAAKLSNMLEMLSVTKAHGLEAEEIQTFDLSIKALRDTGLSVDKTNAYFGSLSWVLSNLLSALCLVFCAYLAIQKQIGVGDIVLYQTLFGSINGYILSLINVVPQFGQGLEAIESVSEIMLSEDVENNVGKHKVKDLEGKVDFENVSYRYPDSAQPVIKNFNLHVKPGECIAVVGASGSGKSTVMNLIIGFLKPTDGALYIDGNNINDIDLSEYRHHISVVPQNSILFSGTIRENITYGLSYYDEEELKKVVDSANVTEFVRDMPKGLDTEIGEHGGKLSGGQKQRITIARALIRNPSILIFDEATSALDNISEYHVQKAISEAIKGRTTFIVAHRLSTIRGADRILVLDNGILAESGTYEQLMALKGKFYELKRLNDMNAKTAEEALDGGEVAEKDKENDLLARAARPETFYACKRRN